MLQKRRLFSYEIILTDQQLCFWKYKLCVHLFPGPPLQPKVTPLLGCKSLWSASRFASFGLHLRPLKDLMSVTWRKKCESWRRRRCFGARGSWVATVEVEPPTQCYAAHTRAVCQVLREIEALEDRSSGGIEKAFRCLCSLVLQWEDWHLARRAAAGLPTAEDAEKDWDFGVQSATGGPVSSWTNQI